MSIVEKIFFRRKLAFIQSEFTIENTVYFVTENGKKRS